MIFTDYGLCYALNGPDMPELRVNKAGADVALEIVLNAETYERIIGPTRASGFLVQCTICTCK